MATEFQKAREAALRASKSSFTYNGRRFRTTAPGQDPGDVIGQGARPGNSITFADKKPRTASPASPAAASTPTKTPASDLRIPARGTASANHDRPSAPERPTSAQSKGDRAIGIAASRTVARMLEEDRATRARIAPTRSKATKALPRSREGGEPTAEELAEGAKREAEERTAAAAKRREEEAAEAATRRAKVDEEDRDTEDGEAREFARRFPPLSDKAGYAERLERRQAIEAAKGKDRELQALEDAITRATKANNGVLVGDLVARRKKLLRQRYGERSLGERSLSAFD